MSLAERLLALEHEGCDALVADEGGRYEIVARRPGEEPCCAVASTTFVRDADVWQVAFHQQAPRP